MPNRAFFTHTLVNAMLCKHASPLSSLTVAPHPVRALSAKNSNVGMDQAPCKVACAHPRSGTNACRAATRSAVLARRLHPLGPRPGGVFQASITAIYPSAVPLLHRSNDCFEQCIGRDPRCIWATRFGKK